MKSRALTVLLLVLAGLGQAQEWRDIRDDVDRSVPPTVRWYLEQRAENARLRELGQPVTLNRMPDSLNIRLVGKWGRGPANKVTGRDSLVFMSLGSEVAIFNCADASHPIIITEIQCRNITGRLVLKDSFLFVGANGPVEVYNIANLTNPRLVCYAPVSGGELAIEDSLCYVLGVDSLDIYNIKNPADFQRVGACRDSGYNMCASDGFVYLCDRWGLYVIDATNPSSPHRATILTGAQTGAAWVEGNYCYYTTASASPSTFRIANVSDPYHPAEIGHIDDISAYDLYKLSFFVYLPGYQIVDVSQPSTPAIVGSVTPGGLGVWTRSPYSYSFLAALSDGLRVVDISDPVHPLLDTMVAGADISDDFSASGLHGFIANERGGMKVLSLANPATPIQVASYDTTAATAEVLAVKARDSVAYIVTMQWLPVHFRAVDVSNPGLPSLLGGCMTWGPGVALEVKESLAFVAEDNHFEIFSITNPRSPRLVGSCQLPNSSYGLFVRDSLAYVGNLTSLKIINVANPASPRIIGSRSMRALGVAVQDTIAIVGGVTELFAVSVADPSTPYLVSTTQLPGEACTGIALDGALAYVGTAANTSRLRVFDISNPESLHSVGYHITPDEVRKVYKEGSLVFAACNNAGVCIFETTSTTGVAEREPGPNRGQTPKLDCWPNPAGNIVSLRLTGEPVSASKSGLFDMSGRLVKDISIPIGRTSQTLQLDLTDLEPGIYFAVWQNKTGKATTKLIKR